MNPVPNSAISTNRVLGFGVGVIDFIFPPSFAGLLKERISLN